MKKKVAASTSKISANLHQRSQQSSILMFAQSSQWNFTAKTKLLILTSGLALIASSQGSLRFGYSSLRIQRINPVVKLAMSHPQISNKSLVENVFAPVRNCSTIDIGKMGSCTTCVFSEDVSNYWTAVLYFKARNGTYKRVPIYGNANLKGNFQVE
jgi:hypothetical protein